MPRKAAFLTLALGICLLDAYPLPSQAREDKSRVLTFEAAPGPAGPLSEWMHWPNGTTGTMFLDSTVVHEGRYSARMERIPGSFGPFSSLALEIPIDFSGDTLELRGWMKYENVTGSVGLLQRQDGTAGTLAFDNMEDRGLKGTADWA